QLQRLNSTFIIKAKEFEDLQDNIEISKLKLEKGLIPEMDIFQMELQASSVLSEMETLKKERRNQMARFAQVLGTQTGIEDMQNSQEDFLEWSKVLKGYVGHYQQPIDNPLTPFFKGEFPQVKIKYIQIEIAERRLKEAEAKNTPVLIPAFTVNRLKNTTQEEFKASVKFTLYDKGVKKEEIKLAQASLSQAKIELNNLLINTRIDITSTLDEIKDTERRMEVLNKDIGISEKIYEIAKIKRPVRLEITT
ncbi:MAG: TolC family protein, partial [bacterium]|nr:TolC family protein [bacterium]